MSIRKSPEYEVLSNGKPTGPLIEPDLRVWRERPWNLLYDVVHSTVLIIRHQDERQFRRVALTDAETIPDGVGSLFNTHLHILQIMAERPGRIFTAETLAPYLDRFLDDRTVVKYMLTIRRLLGDQQSRNPLIRTVRYVDRSISPTGYGYMADPSSSWCVIRYSEKNLHLQQPR